MASQKKRKGPQKSQKLNRTLKELESAFTDWEQLSKNKSKAIAVQMADTPPKPQTPPPLSPQEEEFRRKTKKLLSELREQLAELND